MHSFGTISSILILVYKNNRTYRISILKRTDFVTFWKQNSWCDKSWGDETKEISVSNFPAKRQENFQKNMITGYSVCSEQTAILSILSILLSGAELTEYYSIHSRIRTTNSMYSHSRIVPKECALRNILPNPVLIQDTDLWWQILFANPVQFLIHKKKKETCTYLWSREWNLEYYTCNFTWWKLGIWLLLYSPTPTKSILAYMYSLWW